MVWFGLVWYSLVWFETTSVQSYCERAEQFSCKMNGFLPIGQKDDNFSLPELNVTFLGL